MVEVESRSKIEKINRERYILKVLLTIFTFKFERQSKNLSASATTIDQWNRTSEIVRCPSTDFDIQRVVSAYMINVSAIKMALLEGEASVKHARGRRRSSDRD